MEQVRSLIEGEVVEESQHVMIPLPAELQARLDDLERTAPPEVVEQIHRLDSGDLDSKVNAAERLSAMGQGAEGATRALLMAWTWKDPQRLPNSRLAIQQHGAKMRELNRNVLKTLVSIGGVVVDVMVAALQLDDSSITTGRRREAIDTLQRIGDERSLDGLFEGLADSDEGVRLAAARAIRSTGGQKAVELFIVALRHNDPRVRQAGMELRFVTDTYAETALRKALADEDTAVRLLVVEALGGADKLHPDTVADLRAMLADPDAQVRHLVIRLLGTLRDTEAIDLLIGMLLGPSVRDFTLATAALEAIDSDWETRANIGYFLPQFRTALADADANGRRNAARALGRVRDREAVGLLIEALGDDSKDVAVAAAEALGAIGSNEATTPLIELLSHSDADVRAAAASALGVLADPQALEPLIKALSAELEHGSEMVVKSLAQALGQLRHPRAIDILDRTITQSASPAAETALLSLKLIDTDEAIKVILHVSARPHPKTDNSRTAGRIQAVAKRLLQR